jgi:hypothetical protein
MRPVCEQSDRRRRSIYVIDPLKCTECVGAGEPQANGGVRDYIFPNPDWEETKEDLLKYEQLHSDTRDIDSPATSGICDELPIGSASA